MTMRIERLSVLMLAVLLLGLAESSVMHHHGFGAAPAPEMSITTDDGSIPASPSKGLVGHVCAWCVFNVLAADQPAQTRWIPLALTSGSLAEPPAVLALATITDSHARRGPPAV